MLRVDALLDSVLKTVNPDVVSKITVKPDGTWEASAVCFPDIQPSVHALPLTTPIRHRCLSNFAFVCVLSSLFFSPPPPTHMHLWTPSPKTHAQAILCLLFDPKHGWRISLHVCV